MPASGIGSSIVADRLTDPHATPRHPMTAPVPGRRRALYASFARDVVELTL